MGMLQLNEKSLELNMVLGILENYRPDKKHKDLQERTTKMRNKYKKMIDTFNKVYTAEILPEIQEIKDELQKMNEERYPELKKSAKPEKTTEVTKG